MKSVLRQAVFKAVAAPLSWIMFFSCFLNLSYLAAPLYMMQVYDRVMRSQSIPTLLYLSVAMALAYAVFAILDGVRGQILTTVSDIVEETMAIRLIERATAPVEHSRCRPGAAHIGRDLDTVRQFAAGSAVLVFIDLPWAPIYVGILFMLHWLLGAFAITACAIQVILTLTSERVAREPMAQAGQVAGRAYQFGDALVRYADCASTMGLGASLAARWRGLRTDMLDAQSLASRRSVLLGSLAKFVRMFAQSAILGLGAYLAIRHEIGGGAVFAGSLLLGRCLTPVEAVIASWRVTLAARGAFTRLQEASGPKSSEVTTLPPPIGEVSLEHVTWTPRGSKRAALKDVTLRIEPGAVLAIVGANAAGKSTLGRVLAGALRPDAGLVRLDGSELPSWSAEQLGRAIGYLPQECSLFPGTIRDNIARFGMAQDSEVISAAQAAMAHETILRLPMGYQTSVSDEACALSGGQRRRIALARALLFDPPVLVLDEPNAHLDAEAEAALFRCVISARERRRTVIMITHSTALVRIADFVATMVDGNLLRVQPSKVFLSRPHHAIAGERG